MQLQRIEPGGLDCFANFQIIRVHEQPDRADPCSGACGKVRRFAGRHMARGRREENKPRIIGAHGDAGVQRLCRADAANLDFWAGHG